MEFSDPRVKDFLSKNSIPEATQAEFQTFTYDVLCNTSKKDLQDIAGKGTGYNIFALLHGEGEHQRVKSSTAKKYFDYIRYVFSTIITFLSIGIIAYSIAKGYAALPGHPVMHYILLVFVIILLAYLEGMQIAILALERTSTSEFRSKNRAYTSMNLALRHNGHNVQRFLVGRQFFVVFVVFLCAQLTTYADLNLSFMPPWLFTVLIQTGLPGALIVLAFGQLMPQLIATTNPITFMNLPGTWLVLQLCLCFESVGVTHFSWVLSGTVRFLFSMGAKEFIEAPEAVEVSVHGRPSQSRRGKRLRSSIIVQNVDELYKEAANSGLSKESAAKLKNEKDIMTWLQTNAKIPKTDGLPSASTVCKHLIDNGQAVPRYLLPAWHKLYIPAYLVAYELLRRDDERKDQCDKKKSGSEHVVGAEHKGAI